MIRLVFKKIAMRLLFMLLWFYGKVTRRHQQNVKTVGILFLPVLGIGDLIMLSPFLESLGECFFGAKVYLVTTIPVFLEWQNVEVISPIELKKRKIKFDLIISPTLNLRHLAFVFKARLWIGYFANTICQSNFIGGKCDYDAREDHYALRALHLIRLINKEKYDVLKSQVANRALTYPQYLLSISDKFDKNLVGERYLVLGALSKWPDRQWSVENFVSVINWVLENNIVDKIILIGDRSKENFVLAAHYEKALNHFANRIVNLVGKTTLSEMAWLIKNSQWYFGLDSGPSHFAYTLAQKAVVIFVTVDPKLRLPFLADISKRVCAVYPDPAPTHSLYNGLSPVSIKVTAPWITNITIDQIKTAFNHFI